VATFVSNGEEGSFLVYTGAYFRRITTTSPVTISTNPSNNLRIGLGQISATLVGANGNVSDAEYGFLDGVTSALQTQLNGKQATLTNKAGGGSTFPLLVSGSLRRLVPNEGLVTSLDGNDNINLTLDPAFPMYFCAGKLTMSGGIAVIQNTNGVVSFTANRTSAGVCAITFGSDHTTSHWMGVGVVNSNADAYNITMGGATASGFTAIVRTSAGTGSDQPWSFMVLM
jgi:hypothetical protein